MDLYEIRNQLNSGKTIYDLKLNVTYYARVSTEKDEQAHSLKNQIEYYTDFIKQKQNWNFIEGYIDEGLSGTSVNKREDFLQMIKDAKEKKFDFIITKEISRFSRNTLDSIKYTQQLLGYGVGILFQSDNINTLMPDAELRLTIMSSIAQDEVRKISERVKFGFKRAIKNGVVLGNSKIWGYKKNNGKLEIDEEEAKIVKTIFELYTTQNIGIRKIGAYLENKDIKNNNGNPFSFSTIKGILTNPKYKGYYCGNKTHKYDYKFNDRKYLDETEWVVYKDINAVPPIVSEETWNKANFILQNRSKKLKKDNVSYHNKYLYSGKIICMEHNVYYYRTEYKYKSGTKEVWHCKRYSEKGKSGCDSPVVYTDELNIIVKNAYNELIKNRSSVINKLIKSYSVKSSQANIKAEISKYKNEINNIIQKKDKLLEFVINNIITNKEFEERNIKFNDDIEKIEEKITLLKEQELSEKQISHSIETIKKIILNEIQYDDNLKNELVEKLVDRIEIYKTDNKKKLNVKLYFKILDDKFNCTVDRTDRKNTSVCYEPYI